MVGVYTHRLPWWLSSKEPTFYAGDTGPSLVQEDPLKRGTRQSAPVFLPRKSQERKTLVAYSPWGSQRVRHDLEAQQQQQGIPMTTPEVLGLLNYLTSCLHA